MNSSTSLPFIPLLGLLFIGLKLGRVIEWPWLWVLAPVWGPIASVAIAALVAVGLVVCRCNGRRRGWR